MQILMLAPCLYGDVHGGIQLSGAIAWNALSSPGSGVSSRLLCYGPACRATARKCAPGFQCARTKSVAVIDCLRERGKQDLILVWHIGLLKLVPFVRKANSKLVLFLHGVECWKRLGQFTLRSLRHVHRFIANSSFTWLRFVSFNPELADAPHTIVPLGLDEPDTEYRDPSGQPEAIVVGRMCRSEDYKGHRELIGCWPQVLSKIPDAVLSIIGSGDLEPELRSLVARGSLEKSIRFAGRVSDEERTRSLRNARCLLLPSRAEGFGLVYLEAMRLGRPCLVSVLDAAREVVNPPEAGLSANPDSAEELAAGVIRLLVGTEWERWSRQARSRYESNYTAKCFGLRLLTALASLR